MSFHEIECQLTTVGILKERGSQWALANEVTAMKSYADQHGACNGYMGCELAISNYAGEL